MARFSWRAVESQRGGCRALDRRSAI